MSDYRRFVSYLYEYRNGQKNQNCGFLKAELRNDLFRLEMHVQRPARCLWDFPLKSTDLYERRIAFPASFLEMPKAGTVS